MMDVNPDGSTVTSWDAPESHDREKSHDRETEPEAPLASVAPAGRAVRGKSRRKRWFQQ